MSQIIITPKVFFDNKFVDASSTTIPKSSSLPLEIIADSGNTATEGMQYIDSTAQMLGVYLGTAGNEVLLFIIGNGITDNMFGKIPRNSRVSIRSMQDDDIVTGILTGALFTI